MPAQRTPIAWVESPLQLIGAAEWAAARGARVDLAARLTTQVEETAAELDTRGALFGDRRGYWGIPWRALASHDHWLVGDGFSGQFRLAATVLRPRILTFLDDGLNAVSFAGALTGELPYARPGVAEGRVSRTLAPLALDAIRMRATASRVELFTAFPMGEERDNSLRDLGARVTGHDFSWLRGTRSTTDVLPVEGSSRIVLGSARVEDGLIERDAYLAWVRAQTIDGATYLPHRREPEDLIAEILRTTSARVVRMPLPVEVVLSGADRPVDIVMLRSSAATTLRLVLAGTGSTIRELDVRDARRAIR